jgi:hypothetical protein
MLTAITEAEHWRRKSGYMGDAKLRKLLIDAQVCNLYMV